MFHLVGLGDILQRPNIFQELPGRQIVGKIQFLRQITDLTA